MSEYANKRTRGAFIPTVFAMQGFGILAGGIVALIISAGFKVKYNVPAYQDDPIGSTVPQVDYVWRIIAIFGAFPAMLTYYWRMKMPETEEIAPEEQHETDDSNIFGLFSREFARRHGLYLLGTTTTWFLLDIAFYSQDLFQKDIFSAVSWIPKVKTINVIQEVYRVARAQTLIALFILAGCNVIGIVFTFLVPEAKGRSLEDMAGENEVGEEEEAAMHGGGGKTVPV